MDEPAGGIFAPRQWFICFKRTARFRWASALAMGRYKHVSCFAPLPEVKAWLFYDFGVNAASMAIAPDDLANALINEMVDDALVLAWEPPAMAYGVNLKWAFTCVSAVAHLARVPSSALRPDRFLRDCLTAGATVAIEDDDELREQQGKARPGTGSGEGDCGPREDRCHPAFGG